MAKTSWADRRYISGTDMGNSTIICDGCGLELPVSRFAVEKYYYNCSKECSSIFDDVLGIEFSNPVLFSQVHQLTVDTYCVQHAGGSHPAKSVWVHLSGMHLWNERSVAPREIAKYLRRLVQKFQHENGLRGGKQNGWPEFELPARSSEFTIFDVAMTESPVEHAETVKEWAAHVWSHWKNSHVRIGRLIDQYAVN